MCIKCHSKLNNDDLHTTLSAALLKPYFETWNTTSLNHLFIAATGYNGNENATLAILLLEQYIVWYKQQKYECYIPIHGLEPMPSIGYIERSTNFLKKYGDNKMLDQNKNECINTILTDMNKFATSRLDTFVHHYMIQKNLSLLDKYRFIQAFILWHSYWKKLKSNVIKFCKLIYGFVRL